MCCHRCRRCCSIVSFALSTSMSTRFLLIIIIIFCLFLLWCSAVKSRVGQDLVDLQISCYCCCYYLLYINIYIFRNGTEFLLILLIFYNRYILYFVWYIYCYTYICMYVCIYEYIVYMNIILCPWFHYTQKINDLQLVTTLTYTNIS